MTAGCTAKLFAYHRLRADGGPDYPVLFSFPTRDWEANVHRKLATAAAADPKLAEALSNLTVTTCSRDLPGFHPADAVWAPLGHPGRLSLGALPASRGQPGPLTPDHRPPSRTRCTSCVSRTSRPPDPGKSRGHDVMDRERSLRGSAEEVPDELRARAVRLWRESEPKPTGHHLQQDPAGLVSAVP